jgi:hypothetical protein
MSSRVQPGVRPTPAGPVRWQYWPPKGTSTERGFSVIHPGTPCLWLCHDGASFLRQQSFRIHVSNYAWILSTTHQCKNLASLCHKLAVYMKVIIEVSRGILTGSALFHDIPLIAHAHCINHYFRSGILKSILYIRVCTLVVLLNIHVMGHNRLAKTVSAIWNWGVAELPVTPINLPWWKFQANQL